MGDGERGDVLGEDLVAHVDELVVHLSEDLGLPDLVDELRHRRLGCFRTKVILMPLVEMNQVSENSCEVERHRQGMAEIAQQVVIDLSGGIRNVGVVARLNVL